jgi:3-deoxy-D-manno-octulosonate 8-phosphate phosphatase (KDO 8-P phosphatase)
VKPLTDLPRERIEGIRLLVLDVDGVLTDGRITYSASGDEIKAFHVRDGTAIKYWGRCGHGTAILSGRDSPVVHRRAEELGIGTVRTGAKQKLPAFREILAETGIDAAETAYIGDDLPDLPPMREAALAITVADGVPEAKDAADAVTTRCGGDAAVREVIEHLLRSQGRWDTILERYLP